MVKLTNFDHLTTAILKFWPWSWSKMANFDHLTTVILKFWRWSWSKMANFDHLTTVILKFWPWSWSKIFDHSTMTPGRRPNGQKIMVILPPPPPNYRQRDKLEDMLRSLTVERETIGNCMFWCLSHADAAQEVILLCYRHCQNSGIK